MKKWPGQVTEVIGLPGGVLMVRADGTMSFGQVGELGWYWTDASTPRPPGSITFGMITNEALRLFRNSNYFLKTRDMFEEVFDKDRVMAKMRMRLPSDY